MKGYVITIVIQQKNNYAIETWKHILDSRWKWINYCMECLSKIQSIHFHYYKYSGF